MYKVKLVSCELGEIMEFWVYGLGRAIRKARALIMIGSSSRWEMTIQKQK